MYRWKTARTITLVALPTILLMLLVQDVLRIRVDNAFYNCAGAAYSPVSGGYYPYPARGQLRFDWYTPGDTLLLVDEFGRLHRLHFQNGQITVDYQAYWSVGTPSVEWAPGNPTLVAPIRRGVGLFEVPLEMLFYEIPTIPELTDAKISPDGTQLAGLARSSTTDGIPPRLEIFSLTESSPVRAATYKLRHTSVIEEWSPDNRLLALSRAGLSGWYLTYLHVDSGTVTRSLQSRLRRTCAAWAAWAPADPTRIVFSGLDSRTNGYDLFLEALPTEGRQQTRALVNLTNTANNDEINAVWSPDGDRVAFIRVWNRSDAAFSWQRDLFALSEGGDSPEQRLTTSRDGHEHAPIWSTDGESLLFLNWSSIDREWTLRSVSVTTGVETDLLTLPESWYDAGDN
jgi:dipeptidyl aminopeptidase/acylaminoacyl peptidase